MIHRAGVRRGLEHRRCRRGRGARSVHGDQRIERLDQACPQLWGAQDLGARAKLELFGDGLLDEVEAFGDPPGPIPELLG